MLKDDLEARDSLAQLHQLLPLVANILQRIRYFLLEGLCFHVVDGVKGGAEAYHKAMAQDKLGRFEPVA